MPTYQYQCTECALALEVQQSFSDDSLTVCPECEGRLRKVFNAVGVVFKGSGFYRNDSRGQAPSEGGESSSGAPAAGKESTGAGSSGTDSSSTSSSGKESTSSKDSGTSASTKSSSTSSSGQGSGSAA
ncbi:FmdB family zinc ribbon protein [Aeromicrobium sp. CF4.19]|uniref:FmdB family zinc ribbon protein n=1 Tax=Aeromicrobium sp. CF4.19 TaxID=3373082 RepID=UPI003EE47852